MVRGVEDTRMPRPEYDKRFNCGSHNHTRHIPLYGTDRRPYCSICGYRFPAPSRGRRPIRGGVRG